MLTITQLTPTRRARLAVLAAVAALAVPATAGAQAAATRPARLDPVRVTATRTAEANALAIRAESLYDAPRHWRRAAGMHLRAAELRSVGDERGYRDLSMAAHLYRAAGDAGQARAAMERAADHAARRGDVLAAATAYVDAGLLAMEARRTHQVPALALKAELLARSPLLSSEQRAAIMSRVGYSQIVATIQR